MSDAIAFLWNFILLSVLGIGAAIILVLLLALVFGLIGALVEVFKRPFRLRRLQKRLKDRA